VRKAGTARTFNREDGLALACAFGWLLANALSRRLGLWVAVGGMAMALGPVLLLAGGASLRRELRPDGPKILLGLVAGAVMTGMTYLLYPVARAMLPAVAPQAVSLYATFGRLSGPGAALYLPLVVMGEELVWRGIVQRVATRCFGPTGGVLAATALYALAVLPAGSPLLLLIASACGLYWGTLKALTRTLVIPFTAHLVWDAVVLILVPLTSLGR
jgi:membrane protease YdiL (CAAX protease family)